MTKRNNFLSRHKLLSRATAVKAQSHAAVLSLLLIGTGVVFSLLLLSLLLSFMITRNNYVLGCAVVAIGVLCFIAILEIIWKRFNRYNIAATLLVLLYGCTFVLGALTWGINTPFVILLAGFVVSLSGILLGSRSVLVSLACVVFSLLIVQLLMDHGVVMPRPQNLYPSGYEDIIGYSGIIGILALVTWTSNRQTERALIQTFRAEAALEAEKRSLAGKLQERTRSLREAQLQEMQQLYRFAEIGQLSTALLHDLSNHLTVLTLDIEGLHKKRHSSAIKRAKHSIVYLDRIVDQVKARLGEDVHMERIVLRIAFNEVLKQLKSKILNSKIDVLITIDPRKILVYGDPVRMNQVLTILISNALDAVENNKDPKIHVSGVKSNNKIVLEVRDNGPGVTHSGMSKLFKPSFSTKDDGMGIGLFIAKQIVESHFDGTITYHRINKQTVFRITMPIKDLRSS